MKSITACTIVIVIMVQTELFVRDCFPQGPVSLSPDRQYSIVWREPTDGEAHRLTISDGQRNKDFFEFNRYACVCWEPTGEHFALTDYTGSNVSEAYVYLSSGATKILDVLDIVPPDIRKLYEDNHHGYVEVLSWTEAGMLVHLWGYGDRRTNGFDKTLRCGKKDTQWYCSEEKPARR